MVWLTRKQRRWGHHYLLPAGAGLLAVDSKRLRERHFKQPSEDQCLDARCSYGRIPGARLSRALVSGAEGCRRSDLARLLLWREPPHRKVHRSTSPLDGLIRSNSILTAVSVWGWLPPPSVFLITPGLFRDRKQAPATAWYSSHRPASNLVHNLNCIDEGCTKPRIVSGVSRHRLQHCDPEWRVRQSGPRSESGVWGLVRVTGLVAALSTVELALCASVWRCRPTLRTSTGSRGGRCCGQHSENHHSRKHPELIARSVASGSTVRCWYARKLDQQRRAVGRHTRGAQTDVLIAGANIFV